MNRLVSQKTRLIPIPHAADVHNRRRVRQPKDAFPTHAEPVKDPPLSLARRPFRTNPDTTRALLCASFRAGPPALAKFSLLRVAGDKRLPAETDGGVPARFQRAFCIVLGLEADWRRNAAPHVHRSQAEAGP